MTFSRTDDVSTDQPEGIPLVRRFFTTPSADPYDALEWETRDAVIVGTDGTAVFEQKDVHFPTSWSQHATNVVASKYFRGPMDGSAPRERSVARLIDRVVAAISAWGEDGKYFADTSEQETFESELAHILVNQLACFNSPVWFNVGVSPKPQCSACFIIGVEDDMDSILEWYRTEGNIFKWGSGSGANLSRLRSSMESVTGGGKASGPVSFMRGADAIAGTIKSGGRTRRSAKMVVLDISHPDIEEFISCKVQEEKKALALGEAGFDISLDGEAAINIQYQNANNSVRVSDDFMRAVENDGDWQTRYVLTGEAAKTYRARELMRHISTAAWECADPGVQYDTTINDWHTFPDSGRINASNPCAEFLSADNSACNLASINLLKFLREEGSFDVEAYRHTCTVMILAQEIIVSNSSYPTEKIAKNAEDFRQLGLGYSNLGALLMTLGAPYDSDEGRSWASFLSAIMTGQAYLTSASIASRIGPFDGFEVNKESMYRVIQRHCEAVRGLASGGIPSLAVAAAAKESWNEALRLGRLHGYRNSVVTCIAPTGTISFMMDCFTGDTMVAVADGRNAVSFKDLAQIGADVDVYASWKGRTVVCRMRNIRKIRAGVVVVSVTLDDGSVVRCTPEHQFMLHDGTYCRADNLASGDSLMRFDSVIGHKTGKPRRIIWMGPAAGGNRVLGHCWANQYQLTGARLFPDYNGRSGGLIHHENEDTLDDLYENLAYCANTNEHQRAHWLRKSPEERHAIMQRRQLSRSLEERQASSRKTHAAQSPAQRRARARKAAACHTPEEQAQWTAAGWAKLSPVKRTERVRKGWVTRHSNRALGTHNHKVVSVTLAGKEDVYCGQVDEVHNFAIVTTSNPFPKTDDLSGVIVHNCDTTGIEPDLALVKYKTLVGGGLMKIVNSSVPASLRRLGYDEEQASSILQHLNTQDTIEDAPGLLERDLPVFDCAFKSQKGSRTIHWLGHIKMMAAVQPFISMGISKTINMPEDTTVEEVEKAYIEGWKRGLKALAIYRDGSKHTQVLSTKQAPYHSPEFSPIRHRLPTTRDSITHKFSVQGHEGYITAGCYEDGTPGEIFVTMAKEGSTLSGMLDAFATSISLTLQYGVPLRDMVNKFSYMRFEPSGRTENSEIPVAQSIVDYIFRWLASTFLSEEEKEEFGVLSPAVKAKLENGDYIPPNGHSDSQADAPPCADCGWIMSRSGPCYRCDNCGSTTGCG